MGFGKNPHVAKAEAEEQKAEGARDAKAAELAWREAARQWDRAAARETDSKFRDRYTASADAARAKADGDDAVAEDAPTVPDKSLN